MGIGWIRVLGNDEFGQLRDGLLRQLVGSNLKVPRGWHGSIGGRWMVGSTWLFLLMLLFPLCDAELPRSKSSRCNLSLRTSTCRSTLGWWPP